MREHKTPPEDRRQRAEDPAPRASTPAAALLELQRHAGNRAVGGMLARDAAVEADAEQEKRPSGVTLELGSFGSFDVMSMKLEMKPGREREHPSGDLYVTVPHDERATRLLQASTKGEVIPEVLLNLPRSRMLEIYISNVAFSGTGGGQDAYVSLTLNFNSIEHIRTED